MVRLLGRTTPTSSVRSLPKDNGSSPRHDAPSVSLSERGHPSRDGECKSAKTSRATNERLDPSEFDRDRSIETLPRVPFTTDSPSVAHLGKERSLREFVNDGLISSNRAALLLGMNPKLTLQTTMTPKELHAQVGKLKVKSQGDEKSRPYKAEIASPTGKKLYVKTFADRGQRTTSMQSDAGSLCTDRAVVPTNQLAHGLYHYSPQRRRSDKNKTPRSEYSPRGGTFGSKWDDTIKRRVAGDGQSVDESESGPGPVDVVQRKKLQEVNRPRPISVHSPTSGNQYLQASPKEEVNDGRLLRPLVPKKSVPIASPTAKQKTKSSLPRSPRVQGSPAASQMRKTNGSSQKKVESVETKSPKPGNVVSVDTSAKPLKQPLPKDKRAEPLPKDKRAGFWYQSKSRERPVDNRVDVLLRRSSTYDHDDGSATSGEGSQEAPSLATIPTSIHVDGENNEVVLSFASSDPISNHPSSSVRSGQQREPLAEQDTSLRSIKEREERPKPKGSDNKKKLTPVSDAKDPKQKNKVHSQGTQKANQKKRSMNLLQQKLEEETTIMLMSFSDSTDDSLFSMDSEDSGNGSRSISTGSSGSSSEDSGASSSYNQSRYEVTSVSNLSEMLHAMDKGARVASNGNFDTVEAMETSDSHDGEDTVDNSTIASSVMHRRNRWNDNNTRDTLSMRPTILEGVVDIHTDSISPKSTFASDTRDIGTRGSNATDSRQRPSYYYQNTQQPFSPKRRIMKLLGRY